jgi:hypothetical protein
VDDEKGQLRERPDDHCVGFEVNHEPPIDSICLIPYLGFSSLMLDCSRCEMGEGMAVFKYRQAAAVTPRQLNSILRELSDKLLRTPSGRL